MIKEFKRISAGIVTVVALMGNAHAATTYGTSLSCPAVSDITQKAEGQGFTYSAPAPNGQEWTGENPMAEKSDLKHVKFKMAAIRSSGSEGEAFVACDYEGKKDAGVRIALKTQGVAKPVGPAWKGNECEESDPGLCTFE